MTTAQLRFCEVRRSLAVLPILVALAILASALPVAARSNIAVGWTIPEAAVHDPAPVIAAVEAYKAEFGRYPAIWSLYSKWGHRGTSSNGPCLVDVGRCSFPRESVEALHERGITPMIWWEFIDPWNKWTSKKFSQYKAIVNGKHDQYIKTWARHARNAGIASGKPIIIRFAHEADGRWFPWYVNAGTNTPRNYKKAWWRLWKMFKNVGAKPHVRWLWAQHTPQKVNYPGDKYVDYVGVTVLNFGDHGKHKWKSAKTLMNNQSRAALGFTKKPVIVAEMGTNHVGGNKAKWIRESYNQAYRKNPKVKGIVYLQMPHDPVNGPDWKLESPDGSPMAVYKDLVTSSWRFKGKIK